MKILVLAAAFIAVALASCRTTPERNRMNPLLGEWITPYEVPPFDRIRSDDYLPALRFAIEKKRDEIDAIVSDPNPPTFENTVEAVERSGSLLDRIRNAFDAVNSAYSDETIRSAASAIAPELTGLSDDIHLNQALFDRIGAVYDAKDSLTLDGERTRLLDETYKEFVRGGANLDSLSRSRLREINADLATLTEEFSQNLLAETADFDLHVTDPEDLGDLPESLVSGAEAEARRRGHDSGWSFTLSRPSINPFLQYSPNRKLREEIFKGYAMRGDRGNDHDNNSLIARIVPLRTEKAQLLGYPSYAAFVLDENMAKTPDRVYNLLNRVWKPALKMAVRERDALQEMMSEEGAQGIFAAWDWRYYTERIRRARYNLDEDALRPYFEVSAVRDGAFLVAKKLFGLTFELRGDLPTWYPEQQTFEVKNAEGKHIGILYMDFFARPNKNGGAWMNELRSQSRMDGAVSPIVTTNFNFPPPTDGNPSLLSFTEAETLFHEFGHALHGLLSNVRYRSLSGTNVPRDYVEFPSQVMENWMSEPEVLRLYAKHYKTGDVLPDSLIERINASGTFNQGFLTVEYMAAAYLDMAWHSRTDKASVKPDAFEKAEMKRIGLIDEISPRYRDGYFSHIFGSEPGYASGYYSYLWSEVLDADAFEAFREKGFFDPETARKYRHLLESGGSRPGMELYEEFRGHAPAIEPLLQRRGLLN